LDSVNSDGTSKVLGKTEVGRVGQYSLIRGLLAMGSRIMAYKRWGDVAPPYKSARASLGRLVDFLQGDYLTVVRVPIWCIGIE